MGKEVDGTMKVLLTCPNDSPLAASFSEKGGISVPLGLAYLGAYIRDLPGLQVVGFDNNALKLSPVQYREFIRSEAPDVVAISILTATVYNTWEMARIVKEVLPHAVVVVGGRYVLRYLFRMVARARMVEVFTAASLAVVLGMAGKSPFEIRSEIFTASGTERAQKTAGQILPKVREKT